MPGPHPSPPGRRWPHRSWPTRRPTAPTSDRSPGSDGQYGHEPTPGAYIDTLRRVFAELHRVLAPDGTAWLVLGDSYSGGRRMFYDATGGNLGPRGLATTRPASGLAGKNMLGIPWQTALALQADGWILRNAICWNKPNAMPESVRDRLSCRYEFVFLLTKRERYYFDLDAIREPCHRDKTAWPPVGGRQGGQGCVGGSARRRTTAAKYSSGMPSQRRRLGTNMLPTGRRHTAAHAKGRNPGDVWTIPTRPFRDAHFAVFPIDLPLRCIAAGCRAGGLVLDPFAGAATTGIAARRLGRRFAGIDVNEAYLAVAAARLRDTAAGGGPG
ncbi:MAG: site-specific DNA-methyltransferase [Streptosporangiales bacterium]|nr:site-specific DNA-methyltransferase [Streptosporangiales bacterium]